MDEFVKAHNKIIFETTIESLKKNGFGAEFFATREEAVNFIMNQAADCNSVGIAGTHTVRALGVVPMLEKAGKTMFDHWKLKFGTPEELQCRKDQMRADLFLASVNALTMTAGSAFTMDVSTNASSGNDAVTVSGALALNATTRASRAMSAPV